MRIYNKVALFIDYENFHSTLQKTSSTNSNQYGYAPKLNFEQLIGNLQASYGPIYQEDCVVVANFAHYDQQKGGLNRIGTTINADSFDSRKTRTKLQSSPGKKYVIENYADMRLAYEIGKHAASSPAELYIICSGDKAFSAVGQALRQAGFEVLFLLPDLDTAAEIIKEQFSWLSFDKIYNLQPDPVEPTKVKQSPKGKRNTPADVLCNVISKLRHEFRTPIPVDLIKAMVGPGQADQLIQAAHSQGRVDTWLSPEGVLCISSRDERVYGKIVEQSIRKDFVEKTQILLCVSLAAENLEGIISRAMWRQNLKHALGIGNKEAKNILGKLVIHRILMDGELTHPDMSLEKIISFLHGV